MTQQLVLMNGAAPGPSRHGRLDEETKRVGREGLSQARAALQEAAQRAAARDDERRTRRERELEVRASRAVVQAAALQLAPLAPSDDDESPASSPAPARPTGERPARRRAA
jgi:hypothetical protein